MLTATAIFKTLFPSTIPINPPIQFLKQYHALDSSADILLFSNQFALKQNINAVFFSRASIIFFRNSKLNQTFSYMKASPQNEYPELDSS